MQQAPTPELDRDPFNGIARLSPIASNTLTPDPDIQPMDLSERCDRVLKQHLSALAAGGICASAYAQMLLAKEVGARPYRREKAMATVVARLERYAFPEPNSGCHIWTSHLDMHGYGKLISTAFRTPLAHRIAYEITCGEIPEGMVLDHLCRTPCCVNPSHLEPVSNRENVLRGEGIAARNARKTHCVRGHALAGANLHAREDGTRACRECMRIRSAKAHQRRMARKAASIAGRA